jgi:hypothetical protein
MFCKGGNVFAAFLLVIVLETFAFADPVVFFLMALVFVLPQRQHYYLRLHNAHGIGESLK